jgi:hypothetical protein
MFEKHNQRLIPRQEFVIRQIKFSAVAASLILISLVVGIIGYRTLEGMSYTDAFLNAAMIMGGMGPVQTLVTQAGKVFAGIYALYCGLILLFAAGIFLAPIFHRFLHHFHIAAEDLDEAGDETGEH